MTELFADAIAILSCLTLQTHFCCSSVIGRAYLAIPLASRLQLVTQVINAVIALKRIGNFLDKPEATLPGEEVSSMCMLCCTRQLGKGSTATSTHAHSDCPVPLCVLQ